MKTRIEFITVREDEFPLHHNNDKSIGQMVDEIVVDMIGEGREPSKVVLEFNDDDRASFNRKALARSIKPKARSV